MPEPSDLHVVLGASGGIGNALVRELAARGRRVRAVDRGGTAPVPADVEVRAADVATRDGAAHACADAAVVYHCAQPAYGRWRQEFLPMTRAVLHGAATAGARLVLADNLYMYGPVDRPMTCPTPPPTPRAGSGPRWPSRCPPLTGPARRGRRWAEPRTTTAPAGSTPPAVRRSSPPRSRAGPPAGSARSTSRTPSATCPTSPGAWRRWGSGRRRTG